MNQRKGKIIMLPYKTQDCFWVLIFFFIYFLFYYCQSKKKRINKLELRLKWYRWGKQKQSENIDRECNNSVIKIIGMYALKALECSLSYKW